MRCRVCERFWAGLWQWSYAWEQAHSNAHQLWADDTPKNLALIAQAQAVQLMDPEAAVGLYRKAAEAGSIFAMEMVGWHYHSGCGVEVDFETAEQFYDRAIRGGSWMATLAAAKLFDAAGDVSRSERVLEDGVALGFVPAYFWLARLRYYRARDRQTCQQVRPLLEYAADQGHPFARKMLAQWMLQGKFGLGSITHGFRQTLGLASEYWDQREAT